MSVQEYPIFLRCYGCRRVTTKENIVINGQEKCKCGGRKFMNATPTLAEELSYLARNPSAIRFLWKKPN